MFHKLSFGLSSQKRNVKRSWILRISKENLHNFEKTLARTQSNISKQTYHKQICTLMRAHLYIHVAIPGRNIKKREIILNAISK